MRNTISLLLILITVTSFGQRVSFDDPGLSFSFKKPKKWELIDDGYVVKVSPSIQDTAQYYLTITYFEAASPGGYNPNSDLPQIIPFDAEKKEIQIDNKDDLVELGEFSASVITSQKSEDDINLEITKYNFMKYGQSWYVTSSIPSSSKRSSKKQFIRILKSLRINPK